MKNDLSVIDKIAITLLIIFSFLKLGNFISRVFSIYHIKYLELKGEVVHAFGKDIFFNTWLFIYELIGFVLFVLLLTRSIGIFRRKKEKRNIIRLSLIIIFIYYPSVVISHCFIIGKDRLFFLLPIYLSIAVLLFCVLYFSIFYKKE